MKRKIAIVLGVAAVVGGCSSYQPSYPSPTTPTTVMVPPDTTDPAPTDTPDPTDTYII